MPTRLAILADIHADADGLRQALAQIARFKCHQFVCAGDLVDYGPAGEEAVGLCVERNLPCVIGNHDRWVVDRGRTGTLGPAWDLGPSTQWDELSPATRAYLGSLPRLWTAVIEGVKLTVCHGTPRSDMDQLLPDDITIAEVNRWLHIANADVLLVGHTHRPFAVEKLGGGLIANPGSVLRHGGSGTFGVLELPSQRFTVRRVEDGDEVEIPRVRVGVRDRRG